MTGEQQISVESRSKFQAHGVDGCWISVSPGVRRHADCDCPVVTVTVNAKGDSAEAASEASRLFALRIGTALVNFANAEVGA